MIGLGSDNNTISRLSENEKLYILFRLAVSFVFCMHITLMRPPPAFHSGLCLANHILYEHHGVAGLRTPPAPNFEIDVIEAHLPGVACQSLVPGQWSALNRHSI